ncbi:replication protein A 70 kDa DNA-binding subunit C-like [Tripterygium wilfordii]|uniref:replication protein A 70 kDa DNA-binding subunit C-like n=1 Tax=Tripterygium wilfordii TaxID=458696 RepID=UPI0018F7F886|nr:replication protein A 70 kDa DNA-binding subunit C-like [Tripterygium wilfordii]
MNWEVIARISRLWDSKNVRNNNDLLSLDMLLLDAEGTQIHGKIRKRQVEMFRNKIKEGHIYVIRNFRVVDSDNAYKLVGGDVSINFLPISSFKELSGYDGPPIEHYKFHFQNQDEIIKRLNNHTYLTDVIGLLTGMGKIDKITVNDSLVEKLDLEIEIEGQFKLKTTLWAEKGMEFEESMTDKNKGPFVVIITSTIVKRLYGDICISSTPATKTFVNLDHPATKLLLDT